MWSDAKADKVSIRLRIHSGAAFDPQGKEGVMQLLADSIFPNEASREFFIEDLGGDLEVITNYDFIEINASSRPEGFLTMLETLSTAVSNPTIDKETTAKLRSALAAKLGALEADPSYVANRAVSQRLFGTFPYGRPVHGTPASLEKISFADLIDAKQRFLTADNATIAVVGNFDRSLGLRAIRRFFGNWLKSDRQVPSTFRQPDPPIAEVLTIPSPAADTAMVRIALRGVARNDKDLAASMIYTEILRQRIRSRLTSDQAENTTVENKAYALPGVITIGYTLRSSNGKADPTATISKALSDPVTAAEFSLGKAAFSQTWSKRDRVTLWLDANTYKISSPEAEARMAEGISLADVSAYAEKVRKMPVATVLLNTSSSHTIN
jgi:predicted Zn-dependent peptidase